MGLLSIWNDWKKESGYSTTQQDDFSGLSSDMSPSSGMSGVLERKGASPLAPDGGSGQIMGINLPKSVLTPKAIENQKKAIEAQKNKTSIQSSTYQDPITTGGMGTQQGDISFFQRLSNMANVDFDKAAAEWKDKGGFEGLMANPAFTIGLAFMQAGAQGKTLGQGALNEVIKGAGISQQYKNILDSRKQAPIQATSTDIAEVKSLLSTMNIEDPNVFEKIVGKVKGKNVQAMYDIAAEDIAVELQKEMAALQKANKSGKPLVFDTRRKLAIIRRLVKEGKFKKKGGIPFVTSATLESDEVVPTRAMGGPVKAGKPYVVGEKGPEVVIPKSDGNVLTTDDSQIFAMLLAANPQLQKVSKQRAEKILRARFPEYFEG